MLYIRLCPGMASRLFLRFFEPCELGIGDARLLQRAHDDLGAKGAVRLVSAQPQLARPRKATA